MCAVLQVAAQTSNLKPKNKTTLHFLYALCHHLTSRHVWLFYCHVGAFCCLLLVFFCSLHLHIWSLQFSSSIATKVLSFLWKDHRIFKKISLHAMFDFFYCHVGAFCCLLLVCGIFSLFQKYLATFFCSLHLLIWYLQLSSRIHKFC